MSSIHYKFRSNLEYNTITFDSQAVSLNDLRDAIMLQKKIAKSPDYTLEITNAQTKEVYNDDDALIPKNSSVIVKRVPIQRLAAVTDKSLSKEEEELTEMAFAQLSKTADLAGARASEDDKILAMMSQSGLDFDPSTYLKRAPPNYVCFRCGGKGHFIRNCPTQGDARYNKMQITRQPSGIPREYYLMKMKQEEDLIASLRAMQDENSRFSPVVGSDIVDHSKVPSELQCPMCKKLFTDVVVTPCCGESYCDECIRTYLVENDIICKCGETTSPDNLIANKSLRISVNNFRNQKKELKSVPSSVAVSQPVISHVMLPNSTESVVDFSTTESSGIFTNGNEAPNIQVTEATVMNSPKKFQSEQQPIVGPNVVSHVEMPQMIASIPQHILSGSQALFPSVPGAIYSQSGYVLPQTRMLPGVVGLSIPPGATIIKRLVPVPVGPRIGIPTQTVLPPQFVTHQPLNHLNQGMMARISLAQKSKELLKEPESPMPLTEDEFYMWQSKIKKHDPRSRHRHRSSSRDRYRSRSRSPYYRNHSVSPVGSSQEYKKKSKTKRRRRESSQESGGESSSVKHKSRSEKRLPKTDLKRFVPDHIKRELDEFEFDNEVEFDEEMLSLKKKKGKVKNNEHSVKNTKDSSPTSVLKSFSEGDSNLTKASDDFNVESAENKTLTSSVVNKAAQENLRIPVVGETIAPKRKTRIVKKKIIRVIKKKVPRKKVPLCPDSSEQLTNLLEVNDSISNEVLGKDVSINGEPLPKVELDKIVLVSEDKNKNLDEVISIAEQTAKPGVLVDKKIDDKNAQSFNICKDDKLLHINIDSSEMPENSRWQIEETISNKKLKLSTSPTNKTSVISVVSSRKPSQKFAESDVAQKRKFSQSDNKNIKKRVVLLKSTQSKAEEVAAEVLAKKEAEKLALAQQVKKACASFRKEQSLTSDIEEDGLRRKRERREKYLLVKEKRLAKERQYLEQLKAAKKDPQKEKKAHISGESSSDDDGKIEKRPDQEFYKPGEKLKSISEMSKKRLQQEDQMKSNTRMDQNESDVLKSKISSLTVITAKKINDRASDDETIISNETKDSRRVVCIESNKRLLSSEVALPSEAKLKSCLQGDSIRPLRDEPLTEKRLKQDTDREKRRHIRCETRNDVSDYQRSLKTDQTRREKSKNERNDMSRVQELERERRLAVLEKEQLERKLKKERKLREIMEREKLQAELVNKASSLNAENKSKNISVENFENNSEAEDSTDSEIEKKSNKKKSKKIKERKRKRKREMQENSESEDSEESSVYSSEDDRKKRRKKRKHKSKHKKHRKSKKHKKKTKKKKFRKDSTDKEESNDESNNAEKAVVEKASSDEELSSSTDINQKHSDSDSEKSSSSSGCESKKTTSPLINSNAISSEKSSSSSCEKISSPLITSNCLDSKSSLESIKDRITPISSL
ncbi:putative autophagy-related protein 11 isoform X1 [Hydra vulgaris]|uniref:putative autophagy-related protein 11 isoform X1 n=1 Tax=Hydra vulgaris TaxID=6087 RepID=UPI0006415B46|nr:putative autophagy-related protein 11 isoform X1 [Hydra vulgaris]